MHTYRISQGLVQASSTLCQIFNKNALQGTLYQLKLLKSYSSADTEYGHYWISVAKQFSSLIKTTIPPEYTMGDCCNTFHVCIKKGKERSMLPKLTSKFFHRS